MEERWVDLNGYEGSYQISTYGNLKSLDRVMVHNHNKTPYLKKGRQLKSHKTKHQYRAIGIPKLNQRKTFLVHRLVALQFLEKEDFHTEVNHKDGDKSNNHVENLEWCTREENIKHAWDEGLCKHDGQKCNFSKLTETEVIQIIELRKNGLRVTKISKIFNVTTSAIYSILRGRTWQRFTNITKEQTK